MPLTANDIDSNFTRGAVNDTIIVTNTSDNVFTNTIVDVTYSGKTKTVRESNWRVNQSLTFKFILRGTPANYNVDVSCNEGKIGVTYNT